MSSNPELNRRAGRGLLVCTVLALIVGASTARAGWAPDGVPVCTAENYQGSLVSAPDGVGGMVMVWQDHRGSAFAIYAQRIDENGNLLWTTDGVLVSGASDQQFHPWICGDGTGGAWITWNEREGGYGDIYVQRLDASGNPAWGPPGGQTIRMGSALVDNSLPVCSSDGNGGVVVAWVQEPYPPSGTYQVVAQRIDAGGTVRYTAGGVLVGDDIGGGEEISIAANEEQGYGAFLGWRRSNGTGAAQWVDAVGTPRWGGTSGHNFGIVTSGSRVRLCDRRRASQGAYVMYSISNTPYVTAMDSTAYQFWSESVDPGAGCLDYRVLDNGLNGVYCVWDRPDGGAGDGIYVKNFDYDGDVIWGTWRVSDAVEGHSPDATIEYGYWGIFITWVGQDGGQPRLMFDKVERTHGWSGYDKLLPGGYSSTRPCIAGEYVMNRKPLIAWEDERAAPNNDIYATGLTSTGQPLHPNLVATRMYAGEEPGIAGSGENSFFVMVKNLGTSQAGSFWTTIYPDQATPPNAGDPPPPEVQSVLCAPLDAGDSTLVEVVIEAPESGQTWTMWGFADYLDDVDEFDDEDDNIVGPMSYEWLSLPNLTITQFTLTDYHPVLGQMVQPAIRVENTGTADAGPFDIDFYQNESGAPPVGTPGDYTYRRTAGLTAGGLIVLSALPFTNNDDLSEWHCYARVDTQDEVEESDEDDNLTGPLDLKWDPPNHDGWPVAGGAGFRSAPAIAPLDDNAFTQEVVVGCDDGYLYAWDCEGNPVPGWPVNVGDTLWSSPAVGDITGDFHMEVVIGCNDGHLYAFDHQGAHLWSEAAGYPVHTTPALEDLDGDGKLEVIYAVGASSGGGYVDVLRGNGTQYPTLTEMSLAGPRATSPAVGDVDDDGDYEIAVVSYGLTKPANHSLVYLFKDNGLSYNANWPVQIDTVVVAPPVLGDAASAITGPLEVVLGGLDGAVYVVNLMGGVWPSPPRVGGAIETSPSLVQYDGDQYHEIMVSARRYVSVPPFGYYAGAVALVDDDGSLVNKWPNSAGTWLYGASLASPVATHHRIMVGTPGRYLQGWKNELGSSAPEFPVSVGTAVECALAVGDLDGDGANDVVVATALDSVYCYDFSTSAQFATTFDLEWPMHRNGRTRTGCYVYEPPVGFEDDAGETLPSVTALRLVYPNPFNPATTVAFDLARQSRVTLVVYDVAGRRVATLEDGFLEAGRHEVGWNGSTDSGGLAASGVYFCRLVTPDVVDVKKMVLMK